MDLTDIRIDPDVFSWHLAERLEYRKHVKVNPEYAIWVIEEALDPEDEDAPRLANGMPAAALDIPPEYIVGLIWITEHRFDGRLAYDDVKRALDDFSPQDFVNAIVAAMVVEEPEGESQQDPPAGASEDGAQTPTEGPSPASETSSDSASPTTGPETKRSRSTPSNGTPQ